MNGLYLVCDGGGTKTDFLLFEKTGRVRGRAQGAGANANFVPPAEAAHTVYAGVMECLAQAGAAPAQVREFVLFIPGFRPALPELETLLGSGNVRQLGDEKNAFYAALGAPCGIAVLSGTGSFATGRDKAGRTATAGGWGPLFSDEGSGYHIGVLCLSRLALLHDTHVTASGKKRAGNAGPAGCSVHSRRGIPARFYAQTCGAAELCCGTVGQGGGCKCMRGAG